MHTKLIVTGDINLLKVTDANVPFAQVRDTLRDADLVFSNLECLLYQSPEHDPENSGFQADPTVAGQCLRDAPVHAVGIANNVNYGAAAIAASVARLDELGIGHTGAGANLDAARAPARLTRNGTRFGFLQRTSIYWPTNHEATAKAAGVATVQGHTAYHVPVYRLPGVHAMNRPGIAPVILTWADKKYLDALSTDVTALAADSDVVIGSFHWGVDKTVLQYMTEIAHAAVDAGANLVVGHGAHYPLAVEMYRGRPIFYGLGSFSFHTGRRVHGDWIGLMAMLDFDGNRMTQARLRFVRHNQKNETLLCSLADEKAELSELIERSDALGTKLHVEGDFIVIDLVAD